MSVVELFPTRPAKFIEATASKRRHMAHYEVVAVFHDRTRELIWCGPWRDECNRQIRRAMERYNTAETRIIHDEGAQ